MENAAAVEEEESSVCIAGHNVRSLPRRSRRCLVRSSVDASSEDEDPLCKDECNSHVKDEDRPAAAEDKTAAALSCGAVRFDERKAACGDRRADDCTWSQGFEYLDHTADVIVRAFSQNLFECFAFAGLGLFHCMVDLRGVKPEQQRSVVAHGRSASLLLFHFLDELLFLYGSEYFIACQVGPVEVSERREGGNSELVAKYLVAGERFDCSRHCGGTEVKAVTMHRLQVLLEKRGALNADKKQECSTLLADASPTAQRNPPHQERRSDKEWETVFDASQICTLSDIQSLKTDAESRWACYVVLDI